MHLLQCPKSKLDGWSDDTVSFPFSSLHAMECCDDPS